MGILHKTAMATKVDVPGTDEDVDLTSPTDIIMTFVTVMIGILFVLGAGAAANRAFNFLAGQSDSLEEVDLV